MVKTLSINFLVLIALLGLMEVGIRWYIDYHPGYYMGITGSDECTEYPYGRICLNERGFPDRSFKNRGSGIRIGYFGDSVCYGVGAGMPFRFSDLLDQHYQSQEHFNLCYMSTNLLNDGTLNLILNLAREMDLDYANLVLNFNDFAPLLRSDPKKFDTWQDTGVLEERRVSWNPKISVQKQFGGESENSVQIVVGEDFTVQTVSAVDESEESQVVIQKSGNHNLVATLKDWFYPIDEIFRGRSYLYTQLRYVAKSFLIHGGYESTGFKAIELFPEANQRVFEFGVAKINQLAEQLRDNDITPVLMVLPYEMQISRKAASAYRELGIEWSEGFENGVLVRILSDALDPSIQLIDLSHAFMTESESAELGQFFVHDEGDKLDWNHPNRAGHQKIYEFLVKSEFYKSL